jgi:RNA-binding protein NOB1
MRVRFLIFIHLFPLVKEIAKKTGDFAALSVTDLNLLALVHDLHVQHIGKDSLNYSVKSIVEIMQSAAKEKKVQEQKLPFGFTDLPDEEDDGGWVNESNLVSVFAGRDGAVEPMNGKLAVALMSSDFAVQNVALNLKLNLISIDGLIIKALESYVMFCRLV